MNSTTKKILIVTVSIFLILVVAFALAFRQILEKGEKLTTQVQILKEREAKEASFNRINSLVQDTAVEREEVDNFFFADESDSISFLSDMEDLAQKHGLELKTEALDKILAPDKKTELIKIVFRYSGSRSQVDTFTELLENLPYHSIIDTLSLRNSQGDNWTSNVTLLITIQPNPTL